MSAPNNPPDEPLVPWSLEELEQPESPALSGELPGKLRLTETKPPEDPLVVAASGDELSRRIISGAVNGTLDEQDKAVTMEDLRQSINFHYPGLTKPQVSRALWLIHYEEKEAKKKAERGE